MSSLTWTPNGLVFKSPYDPGLVAQLKSSIPSTERRWDPGRKAWVVDPTYGQVIADLCLACWDERISIPKGNVKAPTVDCRILEIRYLGMTKDRGDGDSERSAFGYSAGSWSVIFPEAVLIAWFTGASATAEAIKPNTLYAVLGLNKNCLPAEIKPAFRRMARQWHPDVCHEPNAADMFIRIKEAYDVLNNPKKRARYNAGLILEASISNPDYKNSDFKDNYRAPLRCGLIIADGIEKVGRFVVSKIHKWEDIKDNQGQTLVVSWSAGADKWDEVWV